MGHIYYGNGTTMGHIHYGNGTRIMEQFVAKSGIHALHHIYYAF